MALIGTLTGTWELVAQNKSVEDYLKDAKQMYVEKEN